MKIRAVVLDLTGEAMDWLDQHGDEEHLELCEVLTLDEDSPIPLSDLNMYDNWDILLVFERGVRDRVAQILKHIGIRGDKVIYPLDEIEGSLYEKKKLSTYIFDDGIGSIIDYISHRKTGDKYSMVSADGISYVNVSTDNVILPEMIMTKRNWAWEDMELFHMLSREYFTFDKTQNIFCDIGANIGTTCIYFKKKLDKNIRILAFEPSHENYKLLKINALLNDIDISEDQMINVGLSDRNETVPISYNLKNPGGSSVLSVESDIKEDVNLVSFDDYLCKSAIDPGEIKYIWIDVEGYEARFLAGARKTLEQINVPVFMEFIPRFYSARKSEFDLLMREIENNFRYFICKDEIGLGKQPVDRLRKEQDNIGLAWDLFLLKE